MKPITLHNTHSMLPRTFHQEGNYPEHFPRKIFFDGKLLTQPRINIKELMHTYVLEVDLPGYDNEDIHVYIRDDKLFIRAFARKRMIGERRFLRKEFDRGIQTRTFLLPPDIDTQRIMTRYKNGMLKIMLLKMDAYPSLN